MPLILRQIRLKKKKYPYLTVSQVLKMTLYSLTFKGKYSLGIVKLKSIVKVLENIKMTPVNILLHNMFED